MNLLNKYRRYKAGNSYGDTNKTELDLFNAELTEKQWQAIDNLERINRNDMGLWCIISALWGMGVGIVFAIIILVTA